MMDFNAYFKGRVEVPRIRHGSKQTLETLINEEALLLASTSETKGKLGFPESLLTFNFFQIFDRRKMCACLIIKNC